MSGPLRDRSRAESLALPHAQDAVLLIVALFGVSASGPLAAATAAPALAIAFWRNALGAGVTGLIALSRSLGELMALSRREWGLCAGAGLFLALHFGTWIPSLTMTTVASSTALCCTQPVFAALIALARGRNLPTRAWVGIAIAVLATVLITGVDITVSARAVAGDLLAVAGGAFAACYVSVGASARTRMSTASYTFICYSCCAVALAIASAIGHQRLNGFSADAWLKIVAITVCAQLLGHTLFNIVLRSTSATVLSLALLFEVPGAGILAATWLHQTPPVTALPGLALLLIGLAVVVSAREPADAVEATE